MSLILMSSQQEKDNDLIITNKSVDKLKKKNYT